MAGKKDIERKTREIIAEQLGIAEDDIQPSSAFIEDLGADSLDLVELMMGIEEEFEIDIGEKDAEEIVTVSDLLEYVATRLDG